jgi:nitrite reductase/ring-hydroxylating ferredoxin subunit
MSGRRIPAGDLETLASRVRMVRLSADGCGRPREALIVRDAAGVVRAYLNLCRHLPIPLDASGQFLVDGLLQCGTHGARYQLEDGLCVSGPCRGASLQALDLVIEGSRLFVIDPAK